MKRMLIPLAVAFLIGCSDQLAESSKPVVESTPVTTPTTGDPIPGDPTPTPGSTPWDDAPLLRAFWRGPIIANANAGLFGKQSIDYDMLLQMKQTKNSDILGYAKMFDRTKIKNVGPTLDFFSRGSELAFDDFFSGGRSKAKVVLLLKFNPGCSAAKIIATITLNEEIVIPKTTQKLSCSVASPTLTVEATKLTKVSDLVFFDRWLDTP